MHEQTITPEIPKRDSLSNDVHANARRAAAIDLTPDEYRRIGHALVDATAALLESIPERPVTPGLTPSIVRAALGDEALPLEGAEPAELIRRATDLLSRYSTFNGHPRFFGYITAGPAPIGVLAELLAAAVNANCGAWSLSPMATEIERRTVQWIAELLGLPRDVGGLFVSGGNMANIVAVMVARSARAGWDVRNEGVTPPPGHAPMVLYASSETHTWVQKAVEMCGLGARAIRWIPVDGEQRMRVDMLRQRVREDRDAGYNPLLVIGTAGTVSTGAVDPLREIATFCRDERIWFHVDGAYGAPAASLAEASEDLKALSEADSVAVDPHKWLYAPVEAGCVLVRDAQLLHETFYHRPPYYHFPGLPGDMPTNFHEWGPQNSRGSRALKVWIALQHVGRHGYEQMIRDDIALARALDDAVRTVPDLQPATCRLSITSFRFVPDDLRGGTGPWSVPDTDGTMTRGDAAARDAYVDALNTTLLSSLQDEGLAYLSNAVLDERFHLRACIVNFRTELSDVLAVPALVARIGRALDHRRRGTASPYANQRDGAERRPAIEKLTEGWWRDRLDRLTRAQRHLLELGLASTRSAVFARRLPATEEMLRLMRELSDADRSAAEVIRGALGTSRRVERKERVPTTVAEALVALREAQDDLLDVARSATSEERTLDRSIVQAVERRALDYEARAARLS